MTGELDPELFAELERERGSAGLSRSAAIRQALEWWLVQRKEQGEERVSRAEGRHRRVMNRLDFIVGMIREQEKREARRRSQRDGAPRPSANPPRDGRAGEEPETEPPDVSAAAPEFEGGALAEARKRARRRLG